MSTIVYAILKKREPFDPPIRMLPDPKYVQVSKDARRYALAV